MKEIYHPTLKTMVPPTTFFLIEGDKDSTFSIQYKNVNNTEIINYSCKIYPNLILDNTNQIIKNQDKYKITKEIVSEAYPDINWVINDLKSKISQEDWDIAQKQDGRGKLVETNCQPDPNCIGSEVVSTGNNLAIMLLGVPNTINPFDATENQKHSME